ncbi:MAG: MerR family transcriptional regulator [Faecousia sp.]
MYTMKETCLKTGLAYETLKFYCNQGLVPNVKRDSQNHRVFDDRDVAWINSLNCLKRCDMGIAEMKEYLALCQDGEETIPKRKRILEAKRRTLEEEQKRIADAIAYIDRKQSFYDDVLSGRTPYFSNLTGTGD